MRRVTCRPFRVLDGMILVAAMAAGFALARLCWPERANFSPHALREWASATVGATLLPCTLACIVIRLMTPRPKVGRLMCQPGMAACCAGMVAIIAGLCRPVLSALRAQYFAGSPAARSFRFYHNFWYIHGIPIGPAVATIWIALALSWRWRPERGWIDVLGRIIGWLWIVFMFVQWEFGRWTTGLVHFLTTWTR
jgi:hypothetical protein